MTINKVLATRQELSEREIVAIEEVQKHLAAFLARPTMYVKEKDAPEIITAFEYVLQYLWKFLLDKKFHRYQNDLKGCLCPSLDNRDLVGVEEGRWVNQDCPYHGY